MLLVLTHPGEMLARGNLLPLTCRISPILAYLFLSGSQVGFGGMPLLFIKSECLFES